MDRSRIPDYVLDDLCSRFIMNIPESYQEDMIRVFFQIELAHWFYLDFWCSDQPEMKCPLKEFAEQIFKHCPLLVKRAKDVGTFLQDFKQYKFNVPTYGAALLDAQLEQCVLVQSFYAKSSWGFPKGKVNEDEDPEDCAAREVLEETGFNIRGMLQPSDFIECIVLENVARLYIVPGVPLNTKFEPLTRCEIKKVQWFNVDELPAHKKDNATRDTTGLNPNNFFMVIPFVKELRKWIARRKQQARGRTDALPGGGSSQAARPLHKERSAKDLTEARFPAALAGGSALSSGLRSVAAAAAATAAEPVAIDDTQKIRQNRYFAEQSQLECKELLEIRQTIIPSSAASRIGTASAGRPGGGGANANRSARRDLEQGLRSSSSSSLKDGGASSSAAKKSYAVLQKDSLGAGKVGKKSLGSEAVSGSNRSSTSTAIATTSVPAKHRDEPSVLPLDIPVVQPSRAWENFKLDYEEILRNR